MLFRSTQPDYLPALAVGIPLARAFGSRWGDPWVFRTATAGFAAASAVCALAPGLGLFLGARIVLGLFGGMVLPAGQRLFVRACLARGLPHGSAAWGVLALSPFSLGTAFGGWLTDNHGFKALFEWNLLVALAALLLSARAWRSAADHAPAQTLGAPGDFDWVAFGLLAGTLFGLQTLLNLGNDFDWLAHDGLRAIAMIRAHGPDLVFLDIGLPGMSVLEVARRLREDAALKPAFLVALSGYGTEEDRKSTRLNSSH